MLCTMSYTVSDRAMMRGQMMYMMMCNHPSRR